MDAGLGSMAGLCMLEGNSNWAGWKFQVKVILKAQGLFSIVDGTKKCPEGNEESIAKWQNMDAKAQSVIVTRLSKNVIMHVCMCETGKEIWDKLLNIYEQKSDVSLHILQQKFFELKHEGEEISLFISKVENLVAQIKHARGDIPEAMVITKIVSSLPQKYRHFV